MATTKPDASPDASSIYELATDITARIRSIRTLQDRAAEAAIEGNYGVASALVGTIETYLLIIESDAVLISCQA